ncbi:YqjF family protein [Xanthomarina gelatinilytica]|jgi:hypothetical protein|uniref:DUF2071 domain-containing protein n=1 Tax=Xanthomarina gelatinilytica TaxID=1137281 RepID=M7MI94_9FLAO|nr:DUF2071 domain-containing protein [Xanthomarina gelatinilytica]EMQ94570.1 hypothetical protein D778_00524 [Xanthomarina gelatinilytica]MDX1318155.1 DUF2071 domain-containing protein [Xanthomarina gelatinilytica]
MTIKEILNSTEHRPWKKPNKSWKYYQEWNDAIFLHWQVELHELKKFVPEELEIDLFEGKPWISVVAFTMEKIRPKNLPAFRPISNFEEINIRTYVKCNNKTGVYFLSIEGGTSLSCKIAKGISQLPYRFSNIKRNTNQYYSNNIQFNDRLKIDFVIGEKINKKTALEHWLVERYALFQDSENTINEFEIHHLEWPLNDIELKNLELNYQRYENLLKNNPIKMHYSKGVKVVAWGKTEITKLKK